MIVNRYKVWVLQKYLDERNKSNFLRFNPRKTLSSFTGNLVVFRGKFWLWLFSLFFLVRVLRIYYGNFYSIRANLKTWGWFLRKCVPTGNAIIIFGSIVRQFMCFRELLWEKILGKLMDSKPWLTMSNFMCLETTS